jgi:hypothetical protein
MVQRTILIKDLEFKANDMATDEKWNFRNCPLLKDPEDYVKAKFTFFGIGNASIIKGFYVYSPSPIHEALTRLIPADQAKRAVTVFKDILCWGGEKSSPAPYMNAVEVIAQGQQHKGLRDEIYCQLIKQLNQNTNEVSRVRYWKLLLGCLKSFPPHLIENYLDYFIRQNMEFP